MKFLWIVLGVAAGLCLLYILSVMGRRHKGVAALRGWNYAHRGLHGKGVPENSMQAFRLALEKGYGIELDVHLLADGELAVIHDSLLVRTTGQPGKIQELTQEQLKDYTLEGTQETIPTFRQVLELFDGKAPMIIELKADGNNAAALTDRVCRELEGYKGVYCIESFDPRCLLRLRKKHPQVIRGQLAGNYLKAKNQLPWIGRFFLTHQMENFLTMPDFVAFDFQQRKLLGNFLVRKLWRVQGVAWTLRSKQEYDQAIQEGWLPIFEYFEP